MEIFWLFGDRDKVAITGEQLDTKWCPVRDSENPQDDTKRAAKALLSWWKKQSCKDNPADPLENNPELLCGSVEDQRDYKDSSTSRVKRGLQGVSRAAGGVNATVQTHWASSQIPLPWTCRLQSWPAPASITSTSAINPTHLGQGLDKVIQPTPSFFAKGFCVPRCRPWPSLICPLRRWLAWAPERVHEAWSERETTSPGWTTQTHRIHCNRPLCCTPYYISQKILWYFLDTINVNWRFSLSLICVETKDRRSQHILDSDLSQAFKSE